MLPACVKTEVWRQLTEQLSTAVNAPVIAGQATFGKLPFFQELRNRTSDTPYENTPGVKYVNVDNIIVGPFKTNEAHALDEELADARHKLPEWKEHYEQLITLAVQQAITAGTQEARMAESLNRAKLLLEYAQETSPAKDVEKAMLLSMQFIARKFKLNNITINALGRHAEHFDTSEAAQQAEQRINAHVKGNKTNCTIRNAPTDLFLDGIKDKETLNPVIIGFPLVTQREVIGTAITYSEHMPNTDYLAEILIELTQLITRLSHYEQMQQTAATDTLTGLPNRAELAVKLPPFFETLKQKQQPISVIMCDVDNFKKYNDTKGHVEGDRLLKSIADLLKSHLPEGALCCRYGGEEFLIVLPTPQQPAKDFAETFRQDVQKSCDSTISIGIMTCMNSSASFDTLVREADRALYRAKHYGKNKTITFVMLDKTLGVIDA